MYLKKYLKWIRTFLVLKSILLTISFDPGFKQAAVIKNAADEGSPGTL